MPWKVHHRVNPVVCRRQRTQCLYKQRLFWISRPARRLQARCITAPHSRTARLPLTFTPAVVHTRDRITKKLQNSRHCFTDRFGSHCAAGAAQDRKTPQYLWASGRWGSCPESSPHACSGRTRRNRIPGHKRLPVFAMLRYGGPIREAGDAFGRPYFTIRDRFPCTVRVGVTGRHDLVRDGISYKIEAGRRNGCARTRQTTLAVADSNPGCGPHHRLPRTSKKVRRLPTGSARTECHTGLGLSCRKSGAEAPETCHKTR